MIGIKKFKVTSDRSRACEYKPEEISKLYIDGDYIYLCRDDVQEVYQKVSTISLKEDSD